VLRERSANRWAGMGRALRELLRRTRTVAARRSTGRTCFENKDCPPEVFAGRVCIFDQGDREGIVKKGRLRTRVFTGSLFVW
jgi:hypothetical protein